MENKKSLNYTQIMDAWSNAKDSYFLVECSINGEKVVYKGFEGLTNFLKLKRLYGNEAVRITTLDKTVGEVLYGEIQD